MFDPFACASSIKENLLSYVASALPIGNHPSQRKLGEAFYSEWSRELFQGPFVEALPKYQTVPSLADYFARQTGGGDAGNGFLRLMSRASSISWAEVEHKYIRFLAARDRLWSQYLHEVEAEQAETSIQRLWKQPLYWHQWEALRIVCNDRRSLIVTTGTGSGKTECYLLPLLHVLFNEPPAKRAVSGVRAIILFPMNALVEDQMRRLRRLLFWINLACLVEPGASSDPGKRPITFGRYTGDTPVADSDPDRSKPSDHIEELGELVTRLQMRCHPPDILVTNFSMLEYALLRSDDQELLKNPDCFKLLVLDEVHTYSGTVGAEVAMLLRRLRAHLSERAGRVLPPPIFVGTSATVGSGSKRVEEMAGFASKLFGAPFQAGQILSGKTIQAPTTVGPVNAEQRRELAVGLERFVRRKPHLLRLISKHLAVNEEAEWDGQVASDLEELAVILNGCWEGMDVEIRNMELLSNDPEARSRELLGQIAQRSIPVQSLIDMIQRSEGACMPLEELTSEYFGTSTEDDHFRQSAQVTISVLLTVAANAIVKGRALFPIRFHHFVTENKEGLVCLNLDCPSEASTDTDGWWKRLFIQHSTHCPSCQCVLYPLVVCRKCGFAYLQGWRGADGICYPEKDDSESRRFKFLFRPISGLGYTAAELDARKRALCLTCGHWFESRDESPYGGEAQSSHASQCSEPRIIEIVEWSNDSSDSEMIECATCEQHWYANHEVVTEPTISPFAAATIFIEELVSSASMGNRTSKLISFSDTRQQAAKLAAKLQRTNRDFVFRQLVFQLLATAHHPLTTLELYEELFREIRNDERKRQLLIDLPERVHDDLMLEQVLADLLFRELTSAYHTLETLGLIRIDYSPRLLALAEGLAIPPYWKKSFDGANVDVLKLVLDWGFRFRHCVSPAAEKIPIRPAMLQQWKIFIKRVPGPQFGRKTQFEAVLFLEKAENRNPLFNFMLRLRKRVRNNNNGPNQQMDRDEFNGLIRVIWKTLFSNEQVVTVGRTSSEASRELLVTRASEPDFGTLQLNLNSLIWVPTQADDGVFQCDVCGRLSHYDVGGVCPVRECQGALRQIKQVDVESRFAPARHYRRLIRERELRPLRVEEHTAEIANPKRLDIERRFRGEDEESVDVISGSTTFELGVDLGSINTVFLANLPPRISNYRQRAGRAGRREGMVPFVLSYVRERPHDQYFWKDLKAFISGPIPTPKFKLSSEEVLRRHGFSVLLAFILGEYKRAGNPSSGLWEPLWKHLAPFISQPSIRSILYRRASDPAGDISKALRGVYEGIEEPVRSKLTPSSIIDAFYQRLAKSQALMASRGDEGCIKVLGDYGILPTYAFPIYVDELRLNEVAPDRPPRCDLELTRDRRISLVEYYPGRTVIAGKSQIQSKGVWAGFDAKPFRRCTACGELFFNSTVTNGCHCGGTCVSLTAVIPWGGYFGSLLGEGVPPEVDYDELSSTEVVFDPANDPRPTFQPIGRFLSVATVDANYMQTARMRQFSPKPGSKRLLQLEKRTDLRDVTAPHTPITCLALADAARASNTQPYHLLHEFPTDILRLRIAGTPQGQAIQSSPRLAEALRNVALSSQKRSWIKQNFWLTLGESLLIASARLLDIDEVGNAELGITFRNETGDSCLDGREFILFDTAPGGAGYSREIAANLKDVFSTAVTILSQCSCGDSCYRCLRSYRNQWIHSRLDRYLVKEGLAEFVSLNWS